MRCCLLNTASPDVVKNIVQESVDIGLVLNDCIVVDILLANLHAVGEAVEDFGYLLLVDGFYILSHESEGVTVCN